MMIKAKVLTAQHADYVPEWSSCAVHLYLWDLKLRVTLNICISLLYCQHGNMEEGKDIDKVFSKVLVCQWARIYPISLGCDCTGTRNWTDW